MTKKHDIPEISTKSTKEQILAAYNDVSSKLLEKQLATPQEQKKQEEKQKIVTEAVNHSADALLTDLSSLKSKMIKQIDSLSEQLLCEFQLLTNLREAIAIEQKHLQELYQINETANTLSVLLQAQEQQKEQFKLEMEQTKQIFTQETQLQKSHLQQQKIQAEQDYKEQKDTLEKTRKREAEEYSYTLELNRRKEVDEYNSKKLLLDKELADLKGDLLKREANLVEKETSYDALTIQVEQAPSKIKEAVSAAEELLRSQLLQQYEFENQLKQREHDGVLKLKEQSISYLEDKVKKQEAAITALTEKADRAAGQVQSIACRALDTSAGRFATLASKPEEILHDK